MTKQHSKRPYTIIFAFIADMTRLPIHVMASNEQSAWGEGWEKLRKHCEDKPDVNYQRDYSILRCEEGHI